MPSFYGACEWLGVEANVESVRKRTEQMDLTTNIFLELLSSRISPE